MSKSKKNTVDPEIMIKEYGADAVRWFILSDSPPEKYAHCLTLSFPNKFYKKFEFKFFSFQKKKISIRFEIENKSNYKNNFVYKIDNAMTLLI